LHLRGKDIWRGRDREIALRLADAFRRPSAQRGLLLGVQHLQRNQPEADLNGLIDASHGCGVERAQELEEPGSIHGTDLAKVDRRAHRQAVRFRRCNRDLQTVRDWRESRRNGSDDRNGAVSVADIVLDHERRAASSGVLTARGIEPDQVDISSPRRGHERFLRAGLVTFFVAVWSTISHASASSGNHSAAISRSRVEIGTITGFQLLA
jgi:hypothetical protein